MYEVNGICYAGKCEEGIQITDARVLQGGIMIITFNSGEQRLFDTTTLKGSAFEPLKDERILKDFTLFHGILTWQDGTIDIAPETVYEESYQYDAVI